MATRREKELEVEAITEKLENSKGAVLTDYRGLNVADMTELREKLREKEIEYKVVKNTLAFLAAKKTGYEDLEEFLSGPTAIAFCEDDPVAPAKVLKEFAEEHEELKIKSGIVEGNIIDVEQVESLADIPPREVLLAQIARGMKSPITGLVRSLDYPLQSLARVLNAIKEEKSE